MSVSVLFVFVCIPVCGGGNVWVQTQECVCVCVPFFISTGGIVYTCTSYTAVGV